MLEILTREDRARAKQDLEGFLVDKTDYILTMDRAHIIFDIGKYWEGKIAGHGFVPETEVEIKKILLKHSFVMNRDYAIENLEVFVTYSKVPIGDEISGEIGEAIDKLHKFIVRELKFQITKPVTCGGTKYRPGDTIFMKLGNNEFYWDSSVEIMKGNIKKLNSLHKRIVSIIKPKQRGRF